MAAVLPQGHTCIVLGEVFSSPGLGQIVRSFLIWTCCILMPSPVAAIHLIIINMALYFPVARWLMDIL